MKKAEFISKVARKSGLSKKDVELVIDASIETITQALKERDKVSFLGFGSFQAVKKGSREVTNPKTGAKITIPEKYSVRFRAGKFLKETVK